MVVTILALLVALLLPALDRAREMARRAECASNLHQWGVALSTYASDNFSSIPVTAWRFNGRYPNVVHAYKDTATDLLSEHNHPEPESAGGEFNVEAMSRYVEGVNYEAETIGGLWYCPSSRTAHRERVNIERLRRWEFFAPDYSYYGRVDLWRSCATRPEQLTARRLSSSRLVMADICHRRIWGANGWRYSHGLNGPSANMEVWGLPIDTGVPQIAGLNQLFGDGSVQWKGRDELDPEAMENMAPEAGAVLGGGPWPHARNYY